MSTGGSLPPACWIRRSDGSGRDAKLPARRRSWNDEGTPAKLGALLALEQVDGRLREDEGVAQDESRPHPQMGVQKRRAVAVEERQNDQDPIIRAAARETTTIDSVLAWRLPCVTRTALGRDVVPEVNMSTASACGSQGGDSGQDGS